MTNNDLYFKFDGYVFNDAFIITNIEKYRHGRIVDTVFYVVDITGALADRQAHIPCGNALIHSKLN